MARKPRVSDVDTTTGETVTADVPPITMPEVAKPTAIDTAPQSEANGSTALSTGTVAVPGIGDNSASEAEALPSAEALHNSILAVVADINRHHTAIDKGIQRLAYLLGQRHTVLTALREAGAVVTLKEIAADAGKFAIYWDAVLAEFVGPAIEAAKAATEADAKNVTTRAAWNMRCRRALELIANLAWCDIDYTAFDHDKGAFPVKPTHFCPQGYTPGPALALDYSAGADKPIPRTVVYIGDDSGSEPYYIGMPKGRQYPITLSVRQFNYSTVTRIRAANAQRRGAAPETNEPTPGRDTRSRQAAAAGETARSAAAQAQAEADRKAAEAKAADLAAKAVAAKNAADEAAGVASLTPAELGEAVNTPEGEGARLHLIATIAKQAMELERTLSSDLITTITWADLPMGCQNALIVQAMWFDRLKGDANHDAETADTKAA